MAKRKTKPKRATAKRPARKAAGKPKTKKPAKSGGSWSAVFAPRTDGERRYWLVKSEPSVFSFDDLLRKHNKTTNWDGIRNFVARNFMRDGMKLGDRVFFYHSSTDAPGVVGICEVVREAYPDDAQYDAASPYHDAKATREKPVWYMVDLRAVAQMTRPVTLTEIKTRKELKHMALLRIGRLSVTPVAQREWDVICDLANRPSVP